MPDAHLNAAYSLVATAPSPASSGTSLVVTAGEGARFPAVPFNATVWATGAQPVWVAGGTTGGNFEIVRVTGRSTDTLTIVRAQEGTSARTVVVGDQIAATVTAKTLTDIETGILNPLRPSAALYETVRRGGYGTLTNNAGLASGIMRMTAIGLPAGLLVTSISFFSGTQALVTGTHQFFGLFDDPAGSSGGSGYALLRGSNDDTSTAWAASSIKTLNLTSTYTTTRAGLFYVAIMVTASTVPSLVAVSNDLGTNITGLAPVVCGTSGSGLTALPNPATAPTAITTPGYYAYVS